MAGVGFLRQLRILLKKNVMIKKKNKRQTAYECLAPIYFVAIIAIIKMAINPVPLPAIPEFAEHSLSNPLFHLHPDAALYVSPASDEVSAVMEHVMDKLGVTYQLYNTSTDAYEAYKEDIAVSNRSMIVGVNFLEDQISNYTLRFPFVAAADTSLQYTISGEGCRAPGSKVNLDCEANKYLFSGFLHLQTVLDFIIVQHTTGKQVQIPDLNVQLMPKNEWQINIEFVQMFSAIYLVLAYSPFILSLTVNLVAEKEKKIKEGMRMMGMSDMAFWCSWGLLYAIFIAIVTVVIVGLLIALKFFQHSNFLLLFVMMFLYGMSVVGFAFICTAFFSKAQTAGVLASFAVLLFSLLYLPISLTRSTGPDGPVSSIPVMGQWALSLLSPVAFALSIDRTIYMDISGNGLRFDTLSDGQFPVMNSIIMLLIDCVLYAVLAFWLDNVVPNEHGMRRPPWFCFTPSYWCYRDKRSAAMLDSQNDDVLLTIADHVEPVASSLQDKDRLRMFDIKKSFKTADGLVKSVDGITLQLYEGQITALLGHNGAGKTTLINMLIGMCPPTEGTASIYGLDITDSNDMTQLRSMTGVCPQHNILYDGLTCSEHLEIFGIIKGVSPDVIKEQIIRSLSEVDLNDKADTIAEELSGGQKRKLSLAIALIGDPQVIFLDEPTAGMDPFSRRHVWSVLKNRRQGKLILLTTHFMDEADILADRKAFISRGRLQCVGSSLFLKNKFGLGYHLSMVLGNDTDIEPISKLVTSHIGNGVISRVHGQELTYTLPLDSVEKFPGLFGALENVDDDVLCATHLGITSYGISITTLEEVFLKLEEHEGVQSFSHNGESVENSDNDTNVMDMIRDTNDDTHRITHSMNIDDDQQDHDSEDYDATQNLVNSSEPDSSVNLFWQRFWAIMIVRWILIRQNKRKFMFIVVLPVLFIIAGCAMLKYLKNGDVQSNDPATMPLVANMYVRGSNPKLPPLALSNSTAGIDPDLLQQFHDSLQVQHIQYDELDNVSSLSEHQPHHVGFWIDKLSDINSSFRLVYNDTSLHSLPVAMTILANTILHINSTSNTVNITTSSHPWPNPDTTTTTLAGGVFGSVMMIGLAFSVIPGSFAVQVVYERQFHIRSQLRISGLSSSMYWFCVFISDLTQYAISATATVVVLLAFKTDAIMNAGAILCVVLLNVLYMPVTLMMAYVISFVFSKFQTAQQTMGNLLSFLSIIPYAAIILLDSSGKPSEAETLHYVMIFINPPYGMFGGLYYVLKVYVHAMIFDHQDDLGISDYMKWETNIPVCFVAPIVQFVILLIALRILEVRSSGASLLTAITSIFPCGYKSPKVVYNHQDQHPFDGHIINEDSDVAAERERLADYEPAPGSVQQPVVVVKGIRKEFITQSKTKQKCLELLKKKKKTVKNHVAVFNNTFGVEAGEVLGLLGPNGAGKTTTLNIIMAEVTPTAGQIYVNGHDVKCNISEAFQAMGYCPQHDALWEDISLQQHLQCYAAISGVPARKIQNITKYYIQNLKLHDHANKKSKALSGGTKRKLSFAMSMLGYPKVVLLDEPSTGMDPKSKRFLWDTISSCFKDSDRGAILTTHYMDEADALCSNIAIMVNGKMQCLGSGQHLKNKFGSGYLLEVKVIDSVDESSFMTQLDEFVTTHFSEASIMERFGERVIYKIPQKNVKSLKSVFAALESERDSLHIEEYSFSQSSLEQVFLEFARSQVEDLDELSVSESMSSSLQQSQSLA